MIADQLDAGAGGVSVSIDAAARMIQVARKKRGNQTKLYMSSANVINFGLPKIRDVVPASNLDNNLIILYIRCANLKEFGR